MFSKEDIKILRIKVRLPYQEGRKNLIEQFISKYPLSTLKFGELQDLMIKVREVLDKIPTMTLNGPGVSLDVGKEKLVLEIEKPSIATPPEGKTDEEVKPFSENNLKRISDDFNFVTAGILGILNLESLKTEAYFRTSKNIDRDLTFDDFLTPDFWSKLEEYEAKHVSGIQIEFNKPITGINAHHNFILSSSTHNSEKKEAAISILSEFELKGPIDLVSIVKDRLETTNTIYGKLTGVI